MKAIVYTQYGPPEVLQLREIARPEPAERQVLVKVRAASANALDYRRFEWISTLGRLLDTVLFKSAGTVLGADIAGVVEAVGSGVTRFRPGDAVFGVAAGSAGGFAEYACAYEKNLVLKPDGVTFEAAAAVPVAALTALQGLRDKGRIQPGQRLLVNGASGGVGSFAIQIARAFGAQVTAVCSPRNLEAARALGAEHVIDYTREDFTRNGRQYDLILAVNGYRPIRDYARALTSQGVYVAAGGSLAQILQAVTLGGLLSRSGGRQFGFMGIADVNYQDLELLRELLETGKLVPAIDRSYPLSQVPDAINYLVQEHGRGKVVIRVAQEA